MLIWTCLNVFAYLPTFLVGTSETILTKFHNFDVWAYIICSFSVVHALTLSTLEETYIYRYLFYCISTANTGTLSLRNWSLLF
jgi:hypothetical protein